MWKTVKNKNKFKFNKFSLNKLYQNNKLSFINNKLKINLYYLNSLYNINYNFKNYIKFLQNKKLKFNIINNNNNNNKIINKKFINFLFKKN